ncbi:MAG: 3-oxoacyl-[acyl-carrier-protein] reductase [Firmicutes bacterium]|nr:3-oxoacyl-[acyl-carrier-protein] reductase [Bacillota bacterium]
MLKGKVAIVTGAARGIGLSIAQALGNAGATLVINDFGLGDAAHLAAADLSARGIETMAVTADVAVLEECEGLVKKTLDRFGRVDILVNNAGITRDKLLASMSEEDWDRVIAINLKGTFNCCKAVVRPMIKNKSGRVINISSVAGVTGNAGQVNYAASKAGVIGITKSLAKELASRGITVNAIAPGLIDTQMRAKLPPAAEEKLLQAIPMGRLGHPEEIAALAAFLASDQAGYITGQVIQVDGGLAI